MRSFIRLIAESGINRQFTVDGSVMGAEQYMQIVEILCDFSPAAVFPEMRHRKIRGYRFIGNSQLSDNPVAEPAAFRDIPVELLPHPRAFFPFQPPERLRFGARFDKSAKCFHLLPTQAARFQFRPVAPARGEQVVSPLDEGRNVYFRIFGAFRKVVIDHGASSMKKNVDIGGLP